MATNVVLPEGFKVVSKPQAALLPDGFKVVQMGNEAQSAITPDPEILAKVNENNEAYANRSHSDGVGIAALEGTLKGIASGAGRIASGATLGATDWIDRKTGGHLATIDDEIQQDANNAGVGGRLKVAQFGNELLGNIGGAGGAIAKGATKLGLKGVKMALGTAGTESLGYGFTDSDSLSDVPLNILKREALALPTAGLLSKGGAVVADKLGKFGQQALEQSGSKSFSLKKFIDALSDINKTAKLKKSGSAGARDVVEQAGSLSDRFKLQKEAMKISGEDIDKELTNSLMLPETQKAQDAYASFINKNGDKVMEAQKVEKYFQQHPVARSVRDEMIETNPRAFDGVTPYSLKEFDMLKQTLRESRHATDTIGKPRADALKRAVGDLKTLMDNQFKGFRSVNKNFAQATSKQNLFNEQVQRNANKVANTTTKDFNSGLVNSVVSALTGAGAVNPTFLAPAAGLTVGRLIARNMAKTGGRNLIYDTNQAILNSNLLGKLGNLSSVYSDFLISPSK